MYAGRLKIASVILVKINDIEICYLQLVEILEVGWKVVASRIFFRAVTKKLRILLFAITLVLR